MIAQEAVPTAEEDLFSLCIQSGLSRFSRACLGRHVLATESSEALSPIRPEDGDGGVAGRKLLVRAPGVARATEVFGPRALHQQASRSYPHKAAH